MRKLQTELIILKKETGDIVTTLLIVQITGMTEPLQAAR